MMNVIQTRLKIIFSGDGFAHNVAVLVGGNAFGQGLAVVASPALTRLYTPEDFGLLSIYMSICSVFTTVSSLRYEAAVTLPEEDHTAANLLVLALLLVILTGLLLSGGFLIMGERFAHWTNAPALRPYLWLLPLSLIGAGSYQALNCWAIRKNSFNRIACTRVTQSVGMVTIQLVLGFFKTGPLGIFLGQVAGQVSGCWTLAAQAWQHDRKVFRKSSLSGIKWAALRYRRFPLFSSCSVLLNNIGLYLPPLLLAAFYGPQVAGWFELGQRVIGAPLTLLGNAVGQVFLAKASRLAREDPGALRRLFLHTAGRLFLIGCVPLALLGVIGPWLFVLVFGSAWLEAGRYTQILFLMFLVRFVVVPLDQTLNIIERQDLQLLLGAGKFSLALGSFLTAKIYGWSHYLAVAAYGLSMLIAYLLLFAVSNYILSKILLSEEARPS